MGFTSKKQEEVTSEGLQELGLERVAQLVIEECSSNSQFKQRVQRAIAAVKEPKSLISLVNKQLAGLARGKKFYEARAASEFSDKLDEVRRAILNEVAPVDVEAAIDLSEKFLAMHGKIFERADDSYGDIGTVYYQGVKDSAELYSRWGNCDRKQLADTVFARYSKNSYGIYNRLIEDFGAVLGAEGLARLEEQLKNQIAGGEGAKMQRSASRFDCIEGLLQVADARGDVDEYIAVVESYKGTPGDYQLLDIAERLLKAERFEEALNRLELVEDASNRADRKRRLKIKALEGLGNAKKAQEIRIELFLASPFPSDFDECLKHAEDPEPLKEELLEAVTSHRYPSTVLGFLTELGEIERAAALVLEHRDRWEGRSYYDLQPAAKRLQTDWPLEATILYRALTEDIVERARSKSYSHAVRYMKALETLSPRIDNWTDLPTHEAYFDRLREAHKRKRALWNKYDSKK
ncbi:MAG: DUF6880 family protein [Cyanobacteria bacterium J06642_2]